MSIKIQVGVHASLDSFKLKADKWPNCILQAPQMRPLGFGPLAQSAREDIWKEIALHRATVVDLTNQLNTLAYTACLPNELLSEIFQQYADLSCESIHDSDSNAVLRPYTFIRVTHVCRHWREVALQTRALWSNIIITHSLLCVETMLSRSRPSAISIQASVGDMESPQGSLKFKALELAIQELERAKVIDLRLPKAWFSLIIEKLGGPAPLLESIALHDPNGCADNYYRVQIDSTKNRLTDVDLCGLAVGDLEQFSSSSLRQLVLKFPSSHCERVLATDLVTTLGSCPRLENLVLVNPIPKIPEPEDVTPRVALPRLQVLNISDLAPHVKWILDSLDVSPDALINVNCTRQQDTGIDWSSLGSSMSAKRSEIDQTYPILAYSVRVFTASSSLLLEGWETEVAPVKTIEDIDDDEIDSPLSIALPTAIPRIQFSAIFRALPLANVVTLYLDEYAFPRETQALLITALSGALPRLINLYLDGWAEASVVVLLAPTTVSDGSQGDQNTLLAFAGLQKMVLRAIKFSITSEHLGQGESSTDDENGEGEDTLADGLRKRQEYHIPLQNLTLEYCIKLRENHVKIIRDVLSETNVQWDGVEQDIRGEWL